MISAERLKYLQDNKQRGDIAAIVKKLNPKANIKGLKFPTAYDIIEGRIWGKWGEVVCAELELIILVRQEIIKLEKEKYAKAS